MLAQSYGLWIGGNIYLSHNQKSPGDLKTTSHDQYRNFSMI